MFVEYRARLWKLICYRLHGGVKRRVDPDDILQDVYLAARQRLHHFRNSTYELPYLWLREVALQTLHKVHRFHLGTQLRDVGREWPGNPSVSDVDGQWESLAASVTSPSQKMIKDEAASALRHTLEQLSEADREIIALRHFEELTNTECAALLELETRAASIRYVRALDRLRVKLEATTLSPSHS